LKQRWVYREFPNHGDDLSYIIGVSSGIFAAAPEAERIQYATLAKKAEYCITKGVQFVQIDLESVSEFKAPDLKEQMEKIKRLGVTFGIHSETKAFGVEVAELDSAIETDYKFGHERLKEILEKAGEIGSKYVLIHSSESTPFLFLERTLQPTALVDFFGNPLKDFLLKEENKWLVDDWLFRKDGGIFMWTEFLGISLEEFKERTRINYRQSYQLEHPGEEPPEEEIKKIIDIHVQREKRSFLDFLQSRHLHYGPERFAYYFIAKWMEENKDPLWENIVKETINFFAKTENKTPKQWLEEKGIKKLSIDDENFRRYSYLWVPAVSAKYIWGHLFQDGTKYFDLKQIIKKYNMPLILETPMAHRGIEEWLRLPNPLQMYYLAKEVNEKVGFECLLLAMDFEHMLSIRLEPEKVIEALPPDGGSYVRVLHVGYPAALAPAHIPIPLGSEQQLYLYKIMYLLRKKQFGTDPKKDFYIVFERGGGPDPIKQSIIALRKIIEFLEKDVKPEELIKHPEFFGIATGEFASPERQWVIIREHAFDPLKGLIATPEEEYTALGKAALEKGAPPEKWKKEELK